MPVVFDITQTMGYEAGEAKNLKTNIENLLRKKMLTPKQIAEAFEVPIERVLEIQQEITSIK